jgi:hypothetical protein
MNIIKALLVVSVALQFCFAQKVANASDTATKVSAVKASGEQKSIAHVVLGISADGKSIIDQQGTVIANIKDGACVKTEAGKVLKDIPGCFCPCDECARYDTKTCKCLEWIHSMRWDFNCNCSK